MHLLKFVCPSLFSALTLTIAPSCLSHGCFCRVEAAEANYMGGSMDEAYVPAADLAVASEQYALDS